MPNTPALVHAGITGLYAPPGLAEADRAAAEGLLAAVGATLWFEAEGDLDAVTAVSGSGPAYVFYAIEALEEAAQHEPRRRPCRQLDRGNRGLPQRHRAAQRSRPDQRPAHPQPGDAADDDA